MATFGSTNTSGSFGGFGGGAGRYSDNSNFNTGRGVGNVNTRGSFDFSSNNDYNVGRGYESNRQGSKIASALIAGLAGTVLGGGLIPGMVAGATGYANPFISFNPFSDVKANKSLLKNEFGSDNFQGIKNNASRYERQFNEARDKSLNRAFDASRSYIDTLYDPTQATGISDTLLEQQYGEATEGFGNQLARGLVTPESYQASLSDLDAQRSTLADTYSNTALGKQTANKQAVLEYFNSLKANPSQVTQNKGQSFKEALQAMLNTRATSLRGGLEQAILDALGSQNPFQIDQARQAGLPGQGVQAVSPLALALTRRDDDDTLSRTIGDRRI